MDEAPQIEVPPGYFTKGLGVQVLLLAALLPTPLLLARPLVGDGSWLGISDGSWLVAALAVPVAHQILVFVGWRSQLCFRSLTRLFGAYDLVVWGLLFLPLLVARPLTLLGLAVADAGSAGLPFAFTGPAAVGLAIPAGYALWSVHRYFGIPRALGGDHFRERYRQMPMVTEGAFGWTGNAMYGVAFLGLWSVALGLNSGAALAVALFQHAWIWVHWYCTEQPDIVLLYEGTAT